MDAKHSQGEPRVLISRAALLHNTSVIRQSLADETRICAILKADAYGHGADIVADTLCNFTSNNSLRPAVDAVAVASLDEATALPECAPPVIIFRPLENAFIGRQRQKIEHAIHAGWTLTVCSVTAAEDLARIAMGTGRRAAVQVMVDTGMTRSGVQLPKVEELLYRIAARPSLRLAGLCTHFANAENCDDPFTREQILRFRAATDDMEAHSRGRVIRHAANSAGLFFHSDSHFDMVRPGLALYGIDPTGKPSLNRLLKPALKWTAPLLSVKIVRKGVGVGYGQTWLAPRDTVIGLIPVGYADGYPRCMSDKAFVLIHGKPVPVVGRVSMDMLTVDLGEIPSAQVGDEAILLDDDPLSPVSVYRLAEWSNTIPYEVFCRIGPRVPRVVVESEQSGLNSAEMDHLTS